MEMIRLMQSTFFHEEEVKQQLCDFIMRSERLSMGEQVAQYESDFAAWQQSPHAVAVNSGSSANLALIQALLNLGLLSRGDEVGFSALTWSTNPMPLFQLGLTPVGIDVELDNLCVSLRTLQDTVARHPSLKCLFITNLLGFCADLDAIAAFCSDHNILLIEDNCESLGSIHHGRKLGNYGIASTFSTFVGHHLSTVEGGVVCTADDDLMDAILLARAHGWNRNLSEQKRNALRQEHNVNSFSDPYTFYDLGFNLRPTEINAVIGQHQLPFLNDIVSLRAANFARYIEAASHNETLRQLSVGHMDLISNFAFPVITQSPEERDPMIQKFVDARVEIRPLVSGNILRQPFFKRYSSQSPSETPNSNLLHDCGFYIPNHPELSEHELSRLADLLRG
jgi:CDP-4-dehydro-6-deoxyglucose reductase, E1